MSSLSGLERHGALVVLVALLDKESMKVSEFMDAVGMERDGSRSLRLHLEGLGLLASTVIRTQGKVEVLDLRLTPRGREVALHVARAKAALEGSPPSGAQPSG